MSKKDEYSENAATENCNHSFKVEAIHGKPFKTRFENKFQVFKNLERITIANGSIQNGAIST